MSYHTEQNEWYHLKEQWKSNQKLLSKVSHHFVECRLFEKQTVARLSWKAQRRQPLKLGIIELLSKGRYEAESMIALECVCVPGEERLI